MLRRRINSERSRNVRHPVSSPKETLDRLTSPRRSVAIRPSTTETERDTFGRDSIKWSIGSSRRSEVEKPASPGPANYDTFDYLTSSPKFTLKSRHEVDYSTPTSKVEIPNIRFFPQMLERKIGARFSADLWKGSDTPMGTLMTNTFEQPRIKIHTKFHRKTERLPGPGAYSPSIDEPVYLASFPKTRKRDAFGVKSFAPGPGWYPIDRSLIPKENWKGQIRPIKVYDYGEND